MGTVAQWSTLKERVAGKWQLPLFFLGLLMLGGSLYLSCPSPRRIPPSQAIEHLDVPNVQIINCHVFLGQPEEARAALARALVVVNAMPQDAFEQSVSTETRGDWKGYFERLGESGLF
jgi:hypothetical protein